jgi:hypothetical protein
MSFAGTAALPGAPVPAGFEIDKGIPLPVLMLFIERSN